MALYHDLPADKDVYRPGRMFGLAAATAISYLVS